VGRVWTGVEKGNPGPHATPERAAAGSNMLNDFTVIRAVMGLHRYMSAHLAKSNRYAVPTFAIAHDVRHFSRHFCLLAASTWTRLGDNAFIFDSARSTPQLSFSVRWLRAHCGAVITASHNPPHDNGFKVYFDDGAQVVPPHDKGIVDEVNQIPLAELVPFLDLDLSRVVTLGEAADAAYHAAAAQAVIDPAVFRSTKLRVGFTPIHGTGGITSVPLLKQMGCEVHEVPEQREFDSRFPSVKSPN